MDKELVSNFGLNQKRGFYATTLNLTSLDFQGNFDRATALVREIARDAREKELGFAVVAFPDLTFSGPGCGDAFLRPETLKKSMQTLLAFEEALTAESRLIVLVGVPVAFDGALYKASAAIVGGKLRGFVCATAADLSPREDLRQFSPWKAGEARTIRIGAREFPIGDLVFVEGELILKRVSVAWIAREGDETFDPFQAARERFDSNALYAGFAPWAGAARRNDAQSASPVLYVDGLRATGEAGQAGDKSRLLVRFCGDVAPFAMGRRDKIWAALRKISEKDGSPILLPGVLGVESGSKIYDGGEALAFDGDAIWPNRFSYVESSFISLTVEMKPDSRCLAVHGAAFRECALGEGEAKRFEEFARAVPLALFDYMRKTRSRGFALSLSGGADSATIATLIRLGVRFGLRERGVRFLNWLSRGETLEDAFQAFPALRDAFNGREDWAKGFSDDVLLEERSREELERALVGALLTTFYQATRNSGSVTREAAREVANACGATYYEFDVDYVVESYKEMVAKSTGRPWSWETDDLALQNIQARGRGPSGWLLANRDGRMLLATGNRSECACGYATMDGDTCGGLSPIAGVDKAFIRKWLRWMETEGVFDGRRRERFRIPALRYVNAQSPTAELRPAEAGQTDESDLMPYVVLNLFERALIRDRLAIRNAIARVASEARAEGVDASDEVFAQWGEKFCRLWDASQWKRQRYAPGFSLDDYDLFPSSWTQYPYLSSGFRAELDDLA